VSTASLGATSTMYWHGWVCRQHKHMLNRFQIIEVFLLCLHCGIHAGLCCSGTSWMPVKLRLNKKFWQGQLPEAMLYLRWCCSLPRKLIACLLLCSDHPCHSIKPHRPGMESMCLCMTPDMLHTSWQWSKTCNQIGKTPHLHTGNPHLF